MRALLVALGKPLGAQIYNLEIDAVRMCTSSFRAQNVMKSFLRQLYISIKVSKRITKDHGRQVRIHMTITDEMLAA